MRHLILVLISGMLLACSSGPDIPASQDGISAMRRGELSRLFDRTGSFDEREADQATNDVLRLPQREQEFIDLFWGGRTNESLHAHRLGNAYLEAAQGKRDGMLSVERSLDRAVAWLERAIRSVDRSSTKGRQTFSLIRYDLARVYVEAGRLDAAFEILANRLDTVPLSSELQSRYDALLRKIGSRQ